MKRLSIFLSFFVIASLVFSPCNKIETYNKKFNVYIKENNNYVKQNSGAFPTTGYTLNTTESSCVGGGVLSQSPSGKINLSMSSAEKCNLYFDPISGGGGASNTVIMNLVGNADPTSTNVITRSAPAGATCTNTLVYDGTSDNNIRYVGQDPCNYVTFNGETAGWRIIGLMNNIDDGTGNLETRIKLVRASALGEYSWDTSAAGINNGYGINDWIQADLMTELNGDYLNTSLNSNTTWYNGPENQKTATFNYTNRLSQSAQNQIGDARWYLGGFAADPERIPNVMYTKERGNEVISGPGDGYSPRSLNWTGKVALIYPSDWGMATSGGNTTSRNVCVETLMTTNDSSGQTWVNPSYSDCNNNNWLRPSSGWYWFLSPYSYNNNGAFDVDSNGSVGNTYTSDADSTRPSVYLKSTIQITGGDGSSTNPYVLG